MASWWFWISLDIALVVMGVVAVVRACRDAVPQRRVLARYSQLWLSATEWHPPVRLNDDAGNARAWIVDRLDEADG